MSPLPAAQTTPDAIAAFDFDGTLTTKDTFVRFIAWHRPPLALATDFVATLPQLLLYATGIVGNDKHKMALFARRFAGMPADDFHRRAREFARVRIPPLLRPAALERLRDHRRRGHCTVIVTASPIDWIAPWAEAEGVTAVIGSAAEVRDGRITGRLDAPNCYGPEKVRRLLAHFPERGRYRLFAFGDGRGDRELLAAADEGFYRRFS